MTVLWDARRKGGKLAIKMKMKIKMKMYGKDVLMKLYP